MRLPPSTPRDESRRTHSDPRPGIENTGRAFLAGDPDTSFVTTNASIDEVWIQSGISKEPHAPRLYRLGRDAKLDGVLMYWFSAVGVQCLTIHVNAYLVDLQMRRIYTRKGTETDLKEVTNALVYQFKKGRQSLAGTTQ